MVAAGGTRVQIVKRHTRSVRFKGSLKLYSAIVGLGG